jgi:hypothetical protein
MQNFHSDAKGELAGLLLSVRIYVVELTSMSVSATSNMRGDIVWRNVNIYDHCDTQSAQRQARQLDSQSAICLNGNVIAADFTAERSR